MAAVEVTTVNWVTTTEPSRRAALARALAGLRAEAAHAKIKGSPPGTNRRAAKGQNDQEAG